MTQLLPTDNIGVKHVNIRDTRENEMGVRDGFFDEVDDDNSSIQLDLSTLRCHKFVNSHVKYRVGPVPIAESSEFISQSTQVAILSSNADGVNFQELKQTLTSGGQETLSRSACDALLSYFYELGTKGGSAQVDYHFLDNMLTGEGGKYSSGLGTVKSRI